MKEKGRKSVAKMLALLLLTCLLSGCTQKDPVVEADAEQVIVEPILNANEAVAEGNESKPKEGGDEVQLPVAPEGYVYDYQVSEEPIPEEIAALGGPVQGTIHAYPSLILKELTRLELEKEPEKKKEAEEYGEAIRVYLLEKYAAECEVEIMEIDDDIEWKYCCREISTDYIFNMSYVVYSDTNKKIFFDGYLYYLGDKIKPQMEEVVKDIFEESSVIKIFTQPDFDEAAKYKDIEAIENYFLYFHIAIFTNENINKLEEQQRIIKLWDELTDLRERIDIWLFIEYYGTEYEDVIQEKYSSSNRDDFSLIGGREYTLLETKEMKAYFDYDSFLEEKTRNRPDINLSTMLEDYKNGIPITEEWSYWN